MVSTGNIGGNSKGKTCDVVVEPVHELDRLDLVEAAGRAEAVERGRVEVEAHLGLVAKDVLDAVKVPPARSG